MRYDFPYGPYGPYGYPPYAFAAAEEKRRVRQEANRTGWAAVAGIALMSALALGGVWVYFGSGNSYNPDYGEFGGVEPVLFYFITALAYVFGLAVPVLVYFAARRIPLSQGLPFERAGVLKTAACVFLGSAACMLANIPANLVVSLEQAFGFSGDLPEMPLNDNPAVIAMYVVSVVVIPPIVEEMMFRGLILQGLRPFGDGFAVVASAAMFGLYHGNFAQAVFAFLCGLALGLVAVKTNSLLPAILVHLVNNGSSVALELMQRYSGAAAANSANSVRLLVLTALGILSVIYLLIRDRGFFRSGVQTSPLRLSAKMGALFSNPGVAVLTLYALAGAARVLAGG